MAEQFYNYPWQNPALRDTIYPFREMKLRDFLLIYKEVDLWAEMKNQDINNPVIRNRLATLEAKSRLAREQVEKALQAGIDSRMQSDTWFARITGRDEKNLRFKRQYYLDRLITDQNQRQSDLESRQKSFLKRLDWYPEGDDRRQTWIGRARELDAPLLAVRQELQELTSLRDLFDQQERLPKTDAQKPLTTADLARAELSDYERSIKDLDHDALVDKVWEKLNEKLPGNKPRFEDWVRYMVIHFSGMRYISAHNSWADPDDLLDLLVREDIKGTLKPGEDIDDAAEKEIQRLMNLPEDASTRGLNPSLKALVFYKQKKDRQGEPVPDWVWDEIVKFTQLRLGVTSEDWEATSPDRYKFENRRWRGIMDSWQRADITIWRKEHRETLDLIVTRAVCNEIAEHIQHLRGNNPAGGLTAKPTWYLRLQRQTDNLPASSPKKCFFRHAGVANDFVKGASIFWLGWVQRQPNAWQVARPLAGIDLWPGVNLFGSKTGKPDKEAPKKQQQAADTDSWSYLQASDAFIRTRRITQEIPSVRELRKQGMTDREIDQYRKDLRAQNSIEKEYLRWKHEATVVEVVERIDGKYVLTFETGKIGLNWHYVADLVNNPYDKIYVGYLPPADQMPENLPRMLDSQKVLNPFTSEKTGLPIKVVPVIPVMPRELVFGEQPLTRELEFDRPLAAPAPAPGFAEQPIPAEPVQRYFVYIITNRARRTLFTGVTLDLKVRVFEHRNQLLPGAPRRKKLYKLVYYHAFENLEEAQVMEDMIQRNSIEVKKDLIEAANPGWRDLADEL